MKPSECSRVARRISSAIKASHSPSRAAVAATLKDLVSAVGGDREAQSRLRRKLPSGVPAMAAVDRAFHAAGMDSPEMRYASCGRWCGRCGKSSVEMRCSPSGDVQRVSVDGRPVRDWKEAVEAVRYAMEDDGRGQDEQDIEGAEEALGSDQFKCKCGEMRDVEFCFEPCPNEACGAEYVICPGCEKPYPMDDNEDDHCPLCGYSSWSELPEEVAAAWGEAIAKAAQQALDTGEPATAEYEGFQANVSIVEKDGKQEVFVSTPEDEDYLDLEQALSGQGGGGCLNGSIDQHLWDKSHP